MPRVPSDAAALIGRRIVAEREDRGLTQEDLGHLSGIDSASIRSHETGRAMLSVRSLLRIATALHKKPNHFLDRVTDEMFSRPTTDVRERAG